MVIKNVTIVGSGLMGNGLAQVFAMDPTTHVILRSRSTKKAPLKPIRDNLDLLVEKKSLTRLEADAVCNRISFTDDLEGSVKNADLIIECVVENMEIKQNLFRDIELYCKSNAILATNTSVMSITEIAKKVKNQSRVIGTHFWNPPYLIPLVEVIKGDKTSIEVMDKIYDYLKKIGKKPVKCMKDVPGFIANRLQHAIWREALSIVENGIADAHTVDEALRYGPGLRWPILGILENADMIGLDLSYDIQKYIIQYLEDSHEPSALLKQLVEQGDLGFKTGKGYQVWTPEQIENSNRRLREYLIDVTKNLK